METEPALLLDGAVWREPFAWNRPVCRAFAASPVGDVRIMLEAPAGAVLWLCAGLLADGAIVGEGFVRLARENDPLGMEVPAGQWSPPLLLQAGYNHIELEARLPERTLRATCVLFRQPGFACLYIGPPRPRFHFTPYQYQMNDPNGLVYNGQTGEYHLYFQCNRPLLTGLRGTTLTTAWGHAVSADLLRWQERPPVLLPDGEGVIFSGSAVVDSGNSSGLFSAQTPAAARLVAFYTSIFGNGRFKTARQCLAYSADGGNTWQKYAKNPVIENAGGVYGEKMRDPKVFWLEQGKAGGRWVMVVGGGRVRLFSSRNLLHWAPEGEAADETSAPIDCECPDLYPLLDEDGARHWVLSAAGVRFFMGALVWRGGRLEFHARSAFTPLNSLVQVSDELTIPDMYAAQTWYNEPLGRRIAHYWLLDAVAPLGMEGKCWNGVHSLPVEMGLKRVEGRLVPTRSPVKELCSLRVLPPVLAERGLVLPAGGVKRVTAPAHCDISAVWKSEAGWGMDIIWGPECRVLVSYRADTQSLTVDKTLITGGFAGVYATRALPKEDGTLDCRVLLDGGIVELYAGEGQAYVAFVLSPPDCEAPRLVLSAPNAPAELISLEAYRMNGAIRPPEAVF